MKRIIYVPLEHIESRYTTHMDRDIQKYLKTKRIPHVVIRPEQFHSPPPPQGCFLNAGFTSKFKSQQMALIASMYECGQITDQDVFFFSDIWFPGIEHIAYMNYFHKVNAKITGIIHAGSFTDTDFVRDMERWAKNFEDMVFDISHTVFCASDFIRQDIMKKRMVHPDKLKISGLPLDISGLSPYKPQVPAEPIVVFNGRMCDEKQPWLFDRLEQLVAERGYQAEFVRTQQLGLDKPQYYDLLSRAQVVVSYALQENFGFAVAEACYLGCVPVLPNRLVYPELYPSEYLYDDFSHSVDMVCGALDNELKPLYNQHVPGVSHKCLDTWFGES